MLANHVLFLDGEALVIDKPAGAPGRPSPRRLAESSKTTSTG